MAYKYMRELLGDIRYSLSTTFEHGFNYFPDVNEFARLQQQMEQAGLVDGATRIKALLEELLKPRIDLHWTAQKAVAQFSFLWEYVRLCERRLAYLEAEESIKASVIPDEKHN